MPHSIGNCRGGSYSEEYPLARLSIIRSICKLCSSYHHTRNINYNLVCIIITIICREINAAQINIVCICVYLTCWPSPSLIVNKILLTVQSENKNSAKLIRERLANNLWPQRESRSLDTISPYLKYCNNSSTVTSSSPLPHNCSRDK